MPRRAAIPALLLLAAACTGGEEAGPSPTSSTPQPPESTAPPPATSQPDPATAAPPPQTTTRPEPIEIPPSPIVPDPGFVLRYAVPGPVDMRSNPFAPRSDGGFPSVFAAHLYRVLPPTFTLIPALATDDEPPPTEFDGTGWAATVELNRGLTWSDGDPIDAFDVQFTFEDLVRFGDPDEFGWVVEDPRGTADLVSVTALDDYTVRITFSARPTIDRWQFGVATASILPEHYWSFIFSTLAPGNEAEPELGLDAPSAGGYRFGPAPAAGEWTWEAVTDWWGSAAEYTVFDSGAVAYRNQRLGIDEVHGGEPTAEVIASWTEGPYAGRIEWRDLGDMNAALFAVSQGRADVVTDGLDAALVLTPSSSVGRALRARGTDGRLRSLVFSPDSVVFSSSTMRIAAACFVQAPFLLDNVMQGKAVPTGWAPQLARAWSNGEVATDPCPASGTRRAQMGLESMRAAGWSWEVEPVVAEQVGQVVLPGAEGLAHAEDTSTALVIVAPHESVDEKAATTSLWLEKWLEEVGFEVEVVRPAPGAEGPSEWDIAVARADFAVPPLPLLHPSADFDWGHLMASSVTTAREAWTRTVDELAAAALAMPLFTALFDNAVSPDLELPYTETAGGLDAAVIATALRPVEGG